MCNQPTLSNIFWSISETFIFRGFCVCSIWDSRFKTANEIRSSTFWIELTERVIWNMRRKKYQRKIDSATWVYETILIKSVEVFTIFMFKSVFQICFKTFLVFNKVWFFAKSTERTVVKLGNDFMFSESWSIWSKWI